MAEKKDRTKKQEKKPRAAKPKQITHSKDKDAYPVPSKKLPARAATHSPAPPKEDEEIDPRALERGDRPMSLVAHLDEFRSRFMRSLITILVIMLGSFFFSDYILSILTGPYLATGLKLNVFNLIDGFLLRLKASLITGILIAFPLIVYELWKYIAPAIDIRERNFSRLAVLAALGLFYLGVALTFFTLPLAVKALLSFTPEGMTNLINASDYLSFVFIFCFAIGIVFELPIAIMILTKIGIVTPSFLIGKRKYAIVLIWILAAVITPTIDPLTQSLVAVPLMLLYEISIIISKVVVIRKKRRELQG